VGVRPLELVSLGVQILTPKGISHAGRLVPMGHLAASVAHEINQPIGAARNNAHAALRFFLPGSRPI
jgi:C4-dicarboxylate-specific signal transduction histidine kinase